MYRAMAALLLAACASAPTAPSESPTSATDGAGDAASSQSPAGADGVNPAAGATSSLDGVPSTEPIEPPPGAKSLPAVNVRNVGLHVGGGPNDAASKQPFLRAIEQHFPDFLKCYRLVGEPGKEGTFGVDLHVPKAGGSAKVDQPRTGLPGDEFKACMVAAFGKVVFEPVAKPAVISYSVRFYLE